MAVLEGILERDKTESLDSLYENLSLNEKQG